jgi:hypothetical protein
MKQWRRGLFDNDYLTLASAVDSAAVQNIVKAIIPKVVWEVGVDEISDPTYVHTNISWSTDPDVWETARDSLAKIILGKSSVFSGGENALTFFEGIKIRYTNANKTIIVSDVQQRVNKIIITDVYGRMVYTRNLKNPNARIEMGRFGRGIYFVKVDKAVKKISTY